MSEGLDVLKEVKERNGLPLNTRFAPITEKEIAIIEKELKDDENYKAMYRLEHEKNQQLSQANLKMSKALEIIVKRVYIELVKDENEYFISTLFGFSDITQEEYDLLKEMLL